MNTDNQPEEAANPSPRTACSRRNATVAEIVDKAIALQEKCGTKPAADFLRRKMVNIEVTARVLLRRAERRNFPGGD